MQLGASSFEVDARRLACGPGQSFCRDTLRESFSNDMRSDACAIETYSADQDAIADYNFWQPTYANQVQKGNAFLNASNDTNRFAPKQVTQESFLQGRGQVTSNPGCKDGFLCYLPQDQFAQPGAGRKPWDMSLFAQSTLVPRSCASVTEVDLLKRMKPLAGAYQPSYSPLQGDLDPQVRGRKKYEEGVTLSTKNIPSFAETAARGRYQ